QRRAQPVPPGAQGHPQERPAPADVQRRLPSDAGRGRRKMRGSRGFTLLEVLVALDIFALVAASILTVTSRSLQNAARLEDKTLAMWVADNRLAEMQLAEVPAGDGRDQGETAFAVRR